MGTKNQFIYFSSIMKLHVWCACEIAWAFAYLHKLGRNGIPELWDIYQWAVDTVPWSTTQSCRCSMDMWKTAW